MEDTTVAPGAPPRADGQALPARGEIWVNAEEARAAPRLCDVRGGD
jgi:hypothetical protein